MWRVVITIQYGKNRHTMYSFFLCVSILQSLQYPYSDFHHTAWWNSRQYIARITKKVWKSIAWELLSYSVCCTIYYHTHSENIDKCGKNPQSARRKTNYHTKCDKNCHKILSVYKDLGFPWWKFNILFITNKIFINTWMNKMWYLYWVPE